MEEQNETKTAKQPVISGKVLWVALGACVVWLAVVGVMLIMKLIQPPLLLLKSSLFAWRLIKESCTLIEASKELYISQRASKMAVLSSGCAS